MVRSSFDFNKYFLYFTQSTKGHSYDFKYRRKT